MVYSILRDRKLKLRAHTGNVTDLIDALIRSRNLFNIQTIEYDLITVTSMDLDESGTFLLVGLSNGGVDILEIDDPRFGSLSALSRLNLSQLNLHRVQWSPTNEQFFSILDNHNLYLVDPVELRAIERFQFDLKTNWSEWNPNDHRVIAVCGSESQVRLVDIRSGSSAQTVILGAPSRLPTHRATRCLWSNVDDSCVIVGDNEGYLHVYDTRQSTRPLILAGEERGQISGMSFIKGDSSIITSQGTQNQLVQWSYSGGTLKPNVKKFSKKKVPKEQSNGCFEAASQCDIKQSKGSNVSAKNSEKESAREKPRRRVAPLSVDAYIRCQFHVTDRHILCPVPQKTRRSKEIYVYDLHSGERITTIKSEGILNQGVFCVTSLMPETLAIMIGGRGRLRLWTIDEDYQRKMDERLERYHQSHWDSDGD